MTSAIVELERTKTAGPVKAMESALTDLDAIVGKALGLDAADISYVQYQMADDDFLRSLSPLWEKRGLRTQSYRCDAENDDEDGAEDE